MALFFEDGRLVVDSFIPKNQAFIELQMKNIEQATTALHALNGRMFSSQKLIVIFLLFYVCVAFFFSFLNFSFFLKIFHFFAIFR